MQDAHSMDIGIILVTTPVTLAVTAGSNTKVLSWLFLLACKLYMATVLAKRTCGKLSCWNRVSLTLLKTSTFGVGP